MTRSAATEGRRSAIVCALLLLTPLVACEPCAIVLGGHCQDRQHDDTLEEDQPAADQPAARKGQPIPLWPAPRARGSFFHHIPGITRHV